MKIISREVLEIAYNVWCLWKSGKKGKFKYKKVAEQVEKELARHPGLHDSKVQHGQIKRWEIKEGWVERFELANLIEIGKTGKPLMPDSIDTDDGKDKGVIGKKKDGKKADNQKEGGDKKKGKLVLSYNLTIQDLKDQRLMLMSLNRKLLNKMSDAIDKYTIDDIESMVYIAPMTSLSKSLAVIQSSLKTSNALFGIYYDLKEEHVITEDDLIERIIAMPEDKRDFIVQNNPGLLEHPRIKELYGGDKNV